MPAKFHEIPSMGLQDIKETKRYGRTAARTDAQTDGQRENSIPPVKLRFGGGYKYEKNLNGAKLLLRSIIFFH